MKTTIQILLRAGLCLTYITSTIPIQAEGLSSAQHGDEVETESRPSIPVTGAIHFIDPDEDKLLQPGETGTFEVEFDEIKGIQPEGKITLTSYSPDYLSVDQNNRYSAEKEGMIYVGSDFEFSEKTLKEFEKKYPGYQLTYLYSDIAYPVYVSPISAVFRLYNPKTSEHLFTSDKAERKAYMENGWTYERIGWYNRAENGQAITRLQTPEMNDHVYTTDPGETDDLVRNGYIRDPVDLFSEGEQDIPIYSCSNPNAEVGKMMYTSDENEYRSLLERGWNDEGIAFYGTSFDRVSTFDPSSPDN